MISFIADLLLSAGIPQRFARFAAWALAVIAVILLVLGLKACYDSSIISHHDADVNLNAAREDRKADQKAAEQRDKDFARQQYEQDQLTEAVKNAPKDPNIPDDRERALAFHRCLRLQQDARAGGLKPPACV